MSSTVLFTVNSTDYSSNVNRRKYNVNSEDEISQWVDANHVTHGDLIRSKVSGSIVLLFIGATAYNAFVTSMNTARGTDGKYAISVYVNNKNATVNINAFLDFSVETVFANEAYEQAPVVFQVTVRLEEE